MLRCRAFCFFFALISPVLFPAECFCEGIDDYLRQAQQALMKQDAEKALELADKAIAADPKDVRGHLMRGAVHEILRKHTEAVADFDKCIKLDPKCAEAYDRRGSEQFKLGRIKDSLADFDRFLELQPKAAPGHWKRGISLYYAGRFDDGRKQFLAGEKVFGDDVENAVWHFLCNAHVVGVEKAREVMLKIGKDKRVPMMEVYDLYLGKAKPADVLKAAEAGRASTELRREQRFYAHLYLGLYYDAVGDKAKAREHMELAADRYRIGHYMADVARIHAQRLRKNVQKEK